MEKEKIKIKMRNQSFTSRRTIDTSNSTWVRNRNTVRHTQKNLGSVSYGFILGLLVIIVGLIYITQGTRATNYDYELSKIEDEISDLEAEKEDLAVERARLTSVATSSTSEVAVSMENATADGYAE